MSAFTEKTVLITGGAGGIGTALARRFGRESARIVLGDRDREPLDRAIAKLDAKGVRVEGRVADVTNPEACGEIVAFCRERFGGVDVLINNAGLTQVSPFIDTDLDVIRRVMEVNFFGAVNMTKAALAEVRAARGNIIALSSIAGFAPLIGRTGYCASKHALHGFFDTLRAELRRDGVAVTIACPSFVATDFARAGLSGDGAQLTFDRSTTGELLTPDAVADAIYRAAAARTPRVIIGRTGKLAWWARRLAPAYYERAMERRFEAELDRG